MGFMLFVLLSLCYSLVSSKVLCELDKSDLSRAQFYGQLNTSMKYPVLEYQNITIYDCARSCRQEVTCLSYSYSSYSEECQLFEYDSETTPEYLTERGGYTYYDMVNRWTNHRDYTRACKSNKKCLNGGSCLNDCSASGFYCVCTEGYRGEFCESAYEHDVIWVDSFLVPSSRGTTAFTFNNRLYIAVGGFYDSNPSSVEAPTSIYRYNEDEDKFELFQELTNTEITLKLSNFVLSGKQYLFVSTYQVFGGSKITNSSLFVYQNATDSFEIHQTFATYGIWGAYTKRTTAGDFFMFLAYHYGDNYDETSEIFKWCPRFEKFFKVQGISTYGACSSSMFEMNGEVYLAVPFYRSTSASFNVYSQVWKQSTTYDSYMGCYKDDSTRALSGPSYSDSSGMTIQTCIDYCRELDYPFAGLQAASHCFCGDDNYSVYDLTSDSECTSQCTGNSGQYCGGSWRNSVYSVSPSWSLLQDLPDTNLAGSTGAVHFNHSGVDYLVMVQHHDSITCTHDTIIFAWNSDTEEFEVHQRLSVSYCPIDAVVFKRGGRVIMVTSNLRQNPSVTSTDEYQISNTFYIMEGTKFVAYRTVEGIDNWDWQTYERNNDLYLVQSSRHNTEGTYSNTTLNIYKWI